MVEHEDTMRRAGFEKPAALRTLVMEDFSLTLYRGQSWGELYDRRVDPQELHNLWDDPAYAETRARLTEALLREMFGAIDESPRARRRA